MPTRPHTERLSAAGFSPWIPLNRMTEFGVGLGCVLSSNGNLTYSVQHTFDELWDRQLCVMSRSTTSLSITLANHGLSVASWAKITGGSIWDGEYAVASITDQNTFVVTVANTGATSGLFWVQKARVFDHDDLDDETASADGNYEFPPRACRLIVTAYTAGYVDLTVIQAGK